MFVFNVEIPFICKKNPLIISNFYYMIYYDICIVLHKVDRHGAVSVENSYLIFLCGILYLAPHRMLHKSINFPGLSQLTAVELCLESNEGEIVIINIQIYCFSLS